MAGQMQGSGGGDSAFFNVPLATDITCRSPVINISQATDGLMVNAFVEQAGNRVFGVKRAGGAAYRTAVSGAQTWTAGNGGVYSNPVNPPAPPYQYSSNIAPWIQNSASATTVSPLPQENSGFFVAATAGNPNSSVAFAYITNSQQPNGQNTQGGITVSTVGGLGASYAPNYSGPNRLPYQLSAVPSTAVAVNYSLSVLGHVETIYQPLYALVQCDYMLWALVQRSQANGSVLYATGVQPLPFDLSIALSDSGITPSIVSLDSTWYIGSASTNRIYSSVLNNPTAWTDISGNGTTSGGGNVLVDSSIGTFLTLQRHQNYLIAFCQQGVQFFYDAGIGPPAAPIAPVQGGVQPVGCAVYGSFQHVNGLLYWLGCDNSSNPFVATYSGTQYNKISTPAIERLLEKWVQPASVQSCISLTLRVSGHTFYLITPAGAPYTLALDTVTQVWALWTDASGTQPFPAQLTALSGQQGAITFNTDGSASYMSQLCYQDGNATGNFNFPVTLQTDPVGGETPMTKLIAATYLLADTQNTNATLQWSDDDYQTWSQPQNISCAVPRKQLLRGGSTIARAFRLKHQDATPFRAQAVQLNIQPAAL